MTELQSIDVAVAGRVPIWDIRPRQERLADPGFIPGSRSIPLTPETLDRIPWQAALQRHPTIALVCLTGRRSEALVRQLWAQGITGVVHLVGGTLGWQAEGYPLCPAQPEEPEDYAGIESLHDLPRVVLSCFVAESVQLQVEQEADQMIDPRVVVERVFARPGCLASFDRVRDALDLLGENARCLGHPIERIASNLNGMRATVLRLEAQQHPVLQVCTGMPIQG